MVSITLHFLLCSRNIIYTASETEVETSRHKCSYVQVIPFSIAHIQRLFSHAFAGVSHTFAMVKLFDNPEQDVDSKLWYIDIDTDSDY